MEIFYFKLQIVESTQIIQQKFFTLSHLSSERATGLARFVNLIGSWSPDHTYTARVRKRCPWEEEKKTTPRADHAEAEEVCCCCCCCCVEKRRLEKRGTFLSSTNTWSASLLRKTGWSSSAHNGNERWTPPKNEYQNKKRSAVQTLLVFPLTAAAVAVSPSSSS